MTKDEFTQVYEKYLLSGLSNVDAYEESEADHFNIYGKYKYDTYERFKRNVENPNKKSHVYRQKTI